GLADADVDEPPFGAFAADLVAKEFRPRRKADRDVETERFPDGCALRVERMSILRLQAVEHSRDRIFNHDPQRNFDLVGCGHGSNLARFPDRQKMLSRASDRPEDPWTNPSEK